MALPTSRDITLNPADPPPSTLLNKLQDEIIGMKRPSGWRWIAPTTPNILSSAGTNSMLGDRLQFGAAGKFTGMPLGMWLEGDRLTGFGVRFLGTGGAVTQKFDLMLNKGDGAPVSLGQLSIVNPPAAWSFYTTAITAHTMLAGESLYLDSTAAGALISSALGTIGIQSDRL